MASKMVKISDIRDFFYNLFYKNGIRKVYFDSLPSDNNFNYGVVIDTGNQMRNRNAFVQGSVNIFVYGKSIGKELSKLEDKVISAIESNKDETFSTNIGYIASDYDAARNLHTTVIMVNLLI